MGFCLGCGQWELLFVREEGRGEKGKGNGMRDRGNRRISETGRGELETRTRSG